MSNNFGDDNGRSSVTVPTKGSVLASAKVLATTPVDDAAATIKPQVGFT